MLNALIEFWWLTEAQIKEKTTRQLAVWRSHKLKAVTKWVDLFGEIPLDQIKRHHAIQFRDWLMSQINDKSMGRSTGKQCFYDVHGIFRTVNLGLRLDLEDPFAGVIFSSKPKTRLPELTDECGFRREKPSLPYPYDLMLKIIKVFKTHRQFEQDFFSPNLKHARAHLSEAVQELRQFCVADAETRRQLCVADAETTRLTKTRKDKRR